VILSRWDLEQNAEAAVELVKIMARKLDGIEKIIEIIRTG